MPNKTFKKNLNMLSILVLLYSLLDQFESATTESALGTNLPKLTSQSRYRVFNDLFKQSTEFDSYNPNNFGRQWGQSLSLGSDLYPSFLNTTQVAGAQINLFNETDTGLIARNITCSFDGDGQVQIYQDKSLILSLDTANNTFNFVLSILDPLMVYITQTNVTNLVRNIQIIPTNVLNDSTIINKTFNQNFLSFLNPFNLLRFCYWQGQNINLANYPILWQNRTTNTSASQVSTNYGISLEHILELTNLLNVIPYLCIPQTSDDNYTIQMAGLIRESLPVDKKIYLEYGNAYTVMNDIPDVILTQKFSLFIDNYGTQYRDYVVFTLNYLNAQYFINAHGMVTRTVDYDYIDCIGVDTSIATDLNVFNAYNVTDAELEAVIINQQLHTEVLINRAYVFSLSIGKDLITFQGSLEIKAPQYGWIFIYDFLKNQTAQNLIYKNEEIQMSSDLHAFQSNTFIKDIFYNWLIRLRNIGIKTIISPILVEPFTDNRNYVPLLENLSSTNNNFYQAFVAYSNNDPCQISLTATDPDVQCNLTCVEGDCVNNSCLCYEGYEGILCDTKSTSYMTDCNNFIGVNIDGNEYWGTQLHFVDVMKTSSSWVLQLPWGGWGSAQTHLGKIKFDSQNYPITLPPNIFLTALMVRNLNNHYEAGTYTVLYDGDGTLSFSMDVVSVTYLVGRIYIQVVPQTQLNNGIAVTIERSNPNDPICNIRVIRPGFEQLYKTLIFHPMFLSQLKPFSVIRFMDFFATNSQTDQVWSNRTRENFRIYSENGAPIETMIKLSNKSGKDMWINVPHLADDDYIQNMASLIYNNLRPDLKVYVEYSNEVWGTLFPGGIYAQEQGLKMGFSTDPDQARFCYLGYITNKISQIFRGVFAATGNGDDKTRLKIVVSTQAVNADTTSRILACQNTYQNVDAIAIAPYFSVPLEDSYSIDDIFNTYIPQTLNQTNTYLEQHNVYLKQYNLEFYNYESGQGFGGNNLIQTNLQISIQTDPRMIDAYISYLTILKNNGVSLTNLYNLISIWSKYGSWGILQYHDIQKKDSMKFMGVINYLNTNNSCNFQYEDFSECPVGSRTGIDTCNNQGVCFLDSCYCYQNFEGQNCEVEKFIDYFYCGYKCNFNKGTCVIDYTINNSRYWGCNCNPGYKGSGCSIPICISECSYNGICVDPDKCECFPGRSGTNCEIDCGCKGHGVCDTTSNTCLCDTGFAFDNSTNKCLPLCNTASGDTTTENCQYPNDLSCVDPLNPKSICSQNGKCYDGQCTCFTGYSGVNCQTYSTGNNSIVKDTMMPLGINLAGLSYWTSQFIFKNYFYQSSVFIPLYYPNYYNSTIQYTWNTGEPFPIFPNGYPQSLKDDQIVVKLLLRDIHLHYPKSLDFLLLYDGDGYVDLGFDSRVANITYRRAGRIEFTAVPSTVLDNGVCVKILKTNPLNPVNNIRIINTADEFTFEKEFLTDSFLEFIKQFSTIRFMDVMDTNGNNMTSIANETLIDQDTQAEPNGVNSDILIKIFKYSGKNPWICIPHMADDNYVTYLATKLKNDIPLHLKIYIEYSNEVWNTMFAQGIYAQEQAKLLGLANYHLFYAKRSLEIFNIFKGVFGANQEYRLKFVLSTQFVSTWVTQQIFSYGNVTQTAHILAVGAYYDCNGIGNSTNAPLTAIKTVDQIIEICNNSLSTMNETIAAQIDIANQYNLTLTAYECGTSISEYQAIVNGLETAGLTDLLIAVNRDPRMQSIYLRVLQTFSDNGLINANAPAMIYSSIGLPSKYGSWGVLDYSDQVYESPSHPKFEAIKQFNNLWIGDFYSNCNSTAPFIDLTMKTCVVASNCSASNPYGDPTTNMCVDADNCSSNNRYGDSITNLCTSVCSSTIPYGDPSTSLCTRKCSSFNPFADPVQKICVTKSNCSKPNIYSDPTTNSCVSTCPPGYYNYLNECFATCPDPNQVDLTNKICYNCGLSQTYFYKNSCVNKCPLYSAPHPTGKPICINCSSLGMIWFQGNCSNTLPAGTIQIDASFNAYESCQDAGQYLVKNACLLACPSPYLPDQNNTCVLNWADNGQYLYNNTVVNACPAGYTNNAKSVCYSCLEVGLLYSDSKCVKSCPFTYIRTNNYICEYYRYYIDDKGVDTCPFGAVIAGNSCSCTNNTVYNSLQNTCAPACKTGLGYYQLNNTCIACSTQNTFTYNLLCVDACPTNTFIDTSTNSCVDIPQTNPSGVSSSTCNPNPCNNSGTCSIIKNLAVCKCPANFYGTFCDVSSQEVTNISNKFQTLFTSLTNTTKVNNSTLQNIQIYSTFLLEFPGQKNSNVTNTITDIMETSADAIVGNPDDLDSFLTTIDNLIKMNS